MVKVANLRKRFNDREVLAGINLQVRKSEPVALIGPSGSGKTTLIRTINGFVVPDAGTIWVGGKEIKYRDRESLRQTRKKIGMIYQLFNLVERTSALVNVMAGALGRLDRGVSLFSSTLGFFSRLEREKAMDLLRFVGLEDKAGERVDRLSGGQKQRVAIARALMQEPELLLADEPIANLDPKSSRKILELLFQINQDKKITLITVLHHLDSVRDHFARVIALKEGAICFDGGTRDLNEHIVQDIYAFDEEFECLPARACNI
ncbi:MAG: phosphonate ABC transporter ATP-binding protein [Desulfobaccales bacterium]|jgi:phosphonate transport system ATP-binding protein